MNASDKAAHAAAMMLLETDIRHTVVQSFAMQPNG